MAAARRLMTWFTSSAETCVPAAQFGSGRVIGARGPGGADRQPLPSVGKQGRESVCIRLRGELDPICRGPERQSGPASRAARQVLQAVQSERHLWKAPENEGEEDERSGPFAAAGPGAHREAGLDLDDEPVEAPAGEPDLEGGGQPGNTDVTMGGGDMVDGEHLDVVPLPSQADHLLE